MELTFLGRGAGFNPAEGSNSAYFIDKNELFLIDSGESVFRLIREKNILDSVTGFNLFITHTHADHVGSLGTLILYAHMVKKLVVNIITDENMAHLPDVRTLLGIYGIAERMYRFTGCTGLEGRYSLFNKVRYVPVKHCDELSACGILFETPEGLVFYSGDMQELGPIQEIIKSGQRIDKLYIDANNDRKPNLHHVSIHLLNDLVPAELKPRVHCMHINSEACAEEARSYGFSVVTV